MGQVFPFTITMLVADGGLESPFTLLEEAPAPFPMANSAQDRRWNGIGQTFTIKKTEEKGLKIIAT